MLHKPALLVAFALLAGCTSLQRVRPAPAPTAAANAEAVQVLQLASYVSALQTIVQGSPTEQAEVLATARGNYESAGHGPATLRYALLLAAPGHPAHDPQTALRLLNETLARPDLLSSTERALAIVESERVKQELGLVNENARLVAESEQERDRQRNAPPSAALAKRLQSEIDDNARLKKELEEAKSKLEAIANIERTIPARPPVNEARKP